MANAKVVYNTLISKLNLPESAEEINALAFATLEHFGISRTDVLANRETEIDQNKLQAVVQRLNQHEPLQYIFNEAWFYGRKFFVDSRVLIPRPETELLVDIVMQNFLKSDSFSVIDIGTGSGCIAITLALEFPKAKITATDVSPAALTVARKNADAMGASIDFVDNDILKGFGLDTKFNCIVSNPPYITYNEKHTMLPNVLQHEPHLALFASETDPLIFYRAIFKTSASILSGNGLLAVEINEQLGEQVIALAKTLGFQNCSNHRDLYGKSRVVTARIR